MSRPSVMNELNLKDIVNVFKCCIFTWDFLPVVLPAFLIAGAIPVFISTRRVLRALGHKAHAVVAYGTSSLVGFVLATCSCNIVPVGVSIYRRGAGLGPAFAFLFAGPAINFVTMVWVVQVVGLKMGVWRAVAVPIIAILTGIIMHALFRREEAERAKQVEAQQAEAELADAPGSAKAKAVLLLFGAMLGILLLGAPGTPAPVKLPAVALLGGLLAWKLPESFAGYELKEWMIETWRFMRMVLPILVVAILLIGLIQNRAWRWVYDYTYPLVGQNNMKGAFIASLFGSIMYFPMLTEIALTKALLKDELIAVGPALALLLNGPGVSLPGAILIARFFGWKKALIYETLEITLGGAVGLAFGKLYGDYHCPCQSGETAALQADPSSIIAAAILVVCILVTGLRIWKAMRTERVLKGESAEA